MKKAYISADLQITVMPHQDILTNASNSFQTSGLGIRDFNGESLLGEDEAVNDGFTLIW